MLNLIAYFRDVNPETVSVLKKFSTECFKDKIKVRLFVCANTLKEFENLCSSIPLSGGIVQIVKMSHAETIDEIIVNQIVKNQNSNQDFPYTMVIENIKTLTKERMNLLKALSADKSDIAIGEYRIKLPNGQSREINHKSTSSQKWFMLDSCAFNYSAFQTPKFSASSLRKLDTYKTVSFAPIKVSEISVDYLQQSIEIFKQRCENQEAINWVAQNPIDELGIFSEIDKIKIDPSHSPFFKKKITLMGCWSTWTAYGELAVIVFACLQKMGFDVEYFSMGDSFIDPIFSEHPRIKNFIVKRPTQNQLAFICHPPNTPSIIGEQFKHRILFTMWETSLLPVEHVRTVLNKCSLILTPSEYSKKCFEDSGCATPIRKQQLGVNPSFYHYSGINGKFTVENPFVFGSAGRLIHGGVRKGVVEVVHAFSKAFGSDPRVQLKLKIYSDDIDLIDPKTKEIIDNSKNIALEAKILSSSGFRDWIGSLDCYLSGSKSEGWGLIQQQACCMGKALVSINYGGVKEFTDKKSFYEIPHMLEAVPESIYQGTGTWGNWREKDLVEILKAITKNIPQAKSYGFMASSFARKFSYQNMYFDMAKNLNI